MIAGLIYKEPAEAQSVKYQETGNKPSALSRHQSLTFALVDDADKTAYGIDHMELQYKGRTLTITAAEIMEALESK